MAIGKMVNGEMVALTDDDHAAIATRRAAFAAAAPERQALKDRLTGKTPAHKAARLAQKFGLTLDELKAALK